MAMGGVFAQADVGCNVNRGEDFANESDRLDDGSFRVICRGTLPIL